MIFLNNPSNRGLPRQANSGPVIDEIFCLFLKAQDSIPLTHNEATGSCQQPHESRLEPHTPLSLWLQTYFPLHVSVYVEIFKTLITRISFTFIPTVPYSEIMSDPTMHICYTSIRVMWRMNTNAASKFMALFYYLPVDWLSYSIFSD
jgi:hypothetical protein